MKVLHTIWVPETDDKFLQSGNFFMWVETDVALGKGTSGLHPRHLQQNVLAEYLQQELSIKPVDRLPLGDRISRHSIDLPSVDGQPLPSPDLLSLSGEEFSAEAFGLRSWQVDSFRLESPLKSLGEIHFSAFYRAKETRPGPDFLFWYWFTQSLRPIILKDQFIPMLVYREKKSRARKKKYEFYSSWQIHSERYEDLIRESVPRMPPACTNGLDKESLLRHCAEVLIDQTVRDVSYKLPAAFKKKIEDSALAPFFSITPTPCYEGADLESVHRWHRWRQKLTGRQDRAGFDLCFRLDEARPEDPDHWTLIFRVGSRSDPSDQLDLEDYWHLDPVDRDAVEGRLGPDFEKHVLLALGTAARIYPKIWLGMETAEPVGLELTLDEAFEFLKESAWILEDAGYRVIVPAWWTPKGRRRAKIRLRSAGGSQAKPSGSSGAGLSLEALLDYQYELAIGDRPVDREEWAQLIDAKSSLVHFRGQWMELDRDKMQEMLAFWQQHGDETPRIGITDLVKKLAEDGDTFEIDSRDSLNRMLAGLGDPSRLEDAGNPAKLKAELREYQKRGVAWLGYLEQLGLNGCLADDMGLGKTLQVIARMTLEKENGIDVRPTLLIAPTSVIGNWQKEIERFAPHLKSRIHYGPQREKDPEKFIEQCLPQDMMISSYPLVRIDAKLFERVEWHRIVLDEAQNIKNPKASQTRAILSLKGKHRLALTGTPVENRLMDLWSIFNFLNPGYLGNQTQFRKKFEVPIQRDHAPIPSTTLKKLVEPFILRRLKTDKNIIQDLPDKVENKQYCNLTREQASLYQAVVEDVSKRLEDSEGIERQGLMLSTLMKLKQVCNHPMQFLQDDSAFTPERSHKLERLSEMLEEVISEGDSALVFTQFTEIGEHLNRFFVSEHRWNTYYLHGGTSRAKRERMINEFQAADSGPSVMVLSVKAGGVGITLTRANHVFHFDRWWNPAVEDQATDRAFRIGQQKNVFVHKFVTLGTLEEQIDTMIEEKKSIAEVIVGSDESWLTRLDNDTFKQLIALNKESVLE